MTAITASMVKDLRDKTGAGMMDCKSALNETNGDMEAAIDWLRKKGLAKAAKKAGRVAAEGLIGSSAERQGRPRWSRSTPRPTSSPATTSSKSSCAHRSRAALKAGRRSRHAGQATSWRRQDRPLPII